MIKIFYKRDVTCSWPPPPVTNSHFLGHPTPLERDVLCGRPLCEEHFAEVNRHIWQP